MTPTKPPTNQREKDFAAAAAVLSAVGVRSDGFEIKMAGEFFLTVGEAMNRNEAELAQVQLDYQAIQHSLEGLNAKSERGRKIRDSLLRKLKDELMTPEELSSRKIRPGRTDEPIPMPAEKRTGRPVEKTFVWTILIIGSPRKWTWEECAAAVFISGADRRSYKAIRKSFREAAGRIEAER